MGQYFSWVMMSELHPLRLIKKTGGNIHPVFNKPS